MDHMIQMRDMLYEEIKNVLPDTKLNGHPEKRLPSTLSLSFPGKEANTLLSELPQLAASAGAACHTDNIEISSVLRAMKVPEIYAMGTIRFSVGKYTTEDEIQRAVSYIVSAVKK